MISQLLTASCEQPATNSILLLASNERKRPKIEQDHISRTPSEFRSWEFLIVVEDQDQEGAKLLVGSQRLRYRALR